MINSPIADVTVVDKGEVTLTVDATNVTSYQWQFSNDGGETWSNIPSSSAYRSRTQSA